MSSQQAYELLGNSFDSVPGGPWPAVEVLDIACGDVRGYCGWHIAPVLTHTLAASGSGGPQLLLPTLRPKHITSVRPVDAVGTLGPPLLRWRPIGAGRLYRAEGWPAGVDNLVVEADHGFDDVPDELLAVIAERARAIKDAPPPGVAADSKTVGSVVRYRQYVSTGASWSVAARSVLDRYRLPS